METENQKNISVNRKAKHEYIFLQTYEAGIVLQGTEVKSLREGKINFADSYASVRKNEVWLISMHISPYKQGNIYNHEPVRDRKLLLHKREIRKLTAQINEKGLTLIPYRMYFKKGKVKVELALAKGKKTYDKREDIKKRDLKREEERNIKF
ncbi:MAG: SsrA-binding protein SmpB [Bacteroidetes bacterium]|nr:SsrA-binding protein SmpB [Bacteroidota bacterium]